MNGSKFDTEAVECQAIDIGRRALWIRYKPYRKERWWGLVVIMPE